VAIDESDPDGVDNYRFVAKDEDGNEIYDYPEPVRTAISINRATNVASDKYGNKYHIIWE
jgi:hypothetical protein